MFLSSSHWLSPVAQQSLYAVHAAFTPEAVLPTLVTAAALIRNPL